MYRLTCDLNTCIVPKVTVLDCCCTVYTIFGCCNDVTRSRDAYMVQVR